MIAWMRKSPLLILDDAGKLAHSALCTLIPLYDDTLHRLGAIVAGTETLERNIKRYVGRVEGYDEIDGRFCRNYIAVQFFQFVQLSFFVPFSYRPVRDRAKKKRCTTGRKQQPT